MIGETQRMNQFVIVRHYIVQRPVSCGRDMLQILFEMKQVSYLSLIKLVIFAASFFQEYPPLSNTISFFFGKLFSPCYKKKKKGRKEKSWCPSEKHAICSPSFKDWKEWHLELGLKLLSLWFTIGPAKKQCNLYLKDQRDNWLDHIPSLMAFDHELPYLLPSFGWGVSIYSRRDQ